MTGSIHSMLAVTAYVTQAQEARLVGRNQHQVLRARKDPTHPVHGPNAIRLGKAKGAPVDEVIAWWPPRFTWQKPGDRGLTRRQWAAVVAIAAGTPVTEAGSGYVLDHLTEWGLLAGGELTELARTMLATHATDGANRQGAFDMTETPVANPAVIPLPDTVGAVVVADAGDVRAGRFFSIENEVFDDWDDPIAWIHTLGRGDIYPSSEIRRVHAILLAPGNVDHGLRKSTPMKG